MATIDKRPPRPSRPLASFHKEATTAHELTSRTRARAPSWRLIKGLAWALLLIG